MKKNKGINTRRKDLKPLELYNQQNTLHIHTYTHIHTGLESPSFFPMGNQGWDSISLSRQEWPQWAMILFPPHSSWEFSHVPHPVSVEIVRVGMWRLEDCQLLLTFAEWQKNGWIYPKEPSIFLLWLQNNAPQTWRIWESISDFKPSRYSTLGKENGE